MFLVSFFLLCSTTVFSQCTSTQSGDCLIICNTSNACQDANLACANGLPCNVECSAPNACDSAEISCPANDPCNVNCNDINFAQSACDSLKVSAPFSNHLSMYCLNDNGCHYSEIATPQNAISNLTCIGEGSCYSVTYTCSELGNCYANCGSLSDNTTTRDCEDMLLEGSSSTGITLECNSVFGCNSLTFEGLTGALTLFCNNVYSCKDIRILGPISGHESGNIVLHGNNINSTFNSYIVSGLESTTEINCGPASYSCNGLIFHADDSISFVLNYYINTSYTIGLFKHAQIYLPQSFVSLTTLELIITCLECFHGTKIQTSQPLGDGNPQIDIRITITGALVAQNHKYMANDAYIDGSFSRGLNYTCKLSAECLDNTIICPIMSTNDNKYYPCNIQCLSGSKCNNMKVYIPDRVKKHSELPLMCDDSNSAICKNVTVFCGLAKPEDTVQRSCTYSYKSKHWKCNGDCVNGNNGNKTHSETVIVTLVLLCVFVLLAGCAYFYFYHWKPKQAFSSFSLNANKYDTIKDNIQSDKDYEDFQGNKIDDL